MMDLILSILTGNTTLSSELISSTDNVNSEDKAGVSPLLASALRGNLVLGKLLLEKGANVNHFDRNGWTALHIAAEYGYADFAKLAIEYGAIVDAADRHGNTPLFKAVYNYKNIDNLISLLLEAGANPDKKNHHGVSPKSLSQSIGNYDSTHLFAV